MYYIVRWIRAISYWTDSLYTGETRGLLYIAKEDLKLRGPGDFFGIRQSGVMDFKLGDIYQDAEVLKQASEECDAILKADFLLETEQNRGLKERIDSYWQEQSGMLNL